MRTLIIVLLLFASGYSFSRDSVRAQLPHLSNWAPGKGAAYREYLHYYGLDTVAASIIAGTFTSDSFECVGQIFYPSHSAGTVFFQHGLFDHSGIVRNGIEFCLKAGFTVAVTDMPGHGLSGGERAGINSFTEYAKAFSLFMELCREHVDTPYLFIGHSTGCALGYEYISSCEKQPFAEILFIAPLARSAFYHVSLAGNSVLPLFTKTTTRLLRKQSHDEAFLTMLKNDPFQTKRFPLRWAKAYFAWWKAAQTYPPKSLPLTIIQGTVDGVVDWRYNMPFYRKKVLGVKIHLVKNGRHQLLNETEEYRGTCMRVIGEVLARVRGGEWDLRNTPR